MRTRAEIIKDINECQQLFDRATMNVGQLYGRYYHTQDEKLIRSVNEKIEVIKVLEVRMRELDSELTTAKD